ncbi:KH domain-containing protein [Candidatus Acetothermia bacterium]|nr:KH domain-containing protein [Candidatus Acetothermia bacterium]MCI2427186.1 KH domain-containing protein [Candidatus Acetothermia bacterium]MCI2428012.1 KH domain-containing protein [Candidatus Acetothermia bacterium]
MVDDPTQIKIARIEAEKVDIMLIKIGKENEGKIVGARGKMIDALRGFLAGVANRTGKEIVVDIMEN